MDKTIINFTPTGMLMTKKDTPYIPISIDEIISDVKKAYEIGITTVHLHARNEMDQSPCYQKEVFREIILGIREFAPDLVIAVTTSGRCYNEFSMRTDVLNLDGLAKPDMGSLTLSSLNFNKTASINEPPMIKGILQKMNERGIKPELEVFDAGMINYAKYLIKKGLLKPPYYFNFILGNIACAQPTLLQTGVLISELPENSICTLGAIGNFQLQTNALAIVSGYGVRVGLEDNIWYDNDRTKLATNEEYLLRIHKMMDTMNRNLCTSQEFRKIASLAEGFGKYGVNEGKA